MSSSENERVWYYIDATTGSQRGPVPANVLLRLLEKGISGILPTTLIWKEGMEKWLMISEIEPFKPIAEFHLRQWYYLDHENNQKGPVYTRFLLHKLKAGEIDGLTLVFSSHLTQWTKTADIPELKLEIQKITEEEERVELLQTSVQITEEEQVFDVTKATDFFDAIAAADTTTAGAITAADGRVKEDKKTFISDDGQRYKWDEEEEAWVEDEDDNDEGEEDVPHYNKQGRRDKKRKAGVAELEEEEGNGGISSDDEEGGEEDKDADGEEKKESEGTASEEQQKPKKKRKNKKRKQKGPNTWVYVTGLPSNVTEEEIRDHFSKVGIIALNPLDQQPKIKIYKEEGTNICKGDCLICYNAEASVKLALDILHEGYIRPNYQITVTRATFDYSQKDENNNHTKTSNNNTGEDGKEKKRKSNISHAQILVAKNAIKQALTWNEDDDMGISKASALRIIVLENMFTLQEMKETNNTGGIDYADELEKDIAEEVGKIGTIEKITIFTKNPKGIIVIKFQTAFAAQECIRIMNGRFFAGKKIKCYFWDGVTNYSMVPKTMIEEDEEDKKEEDRLNEFGDWLEQEQEELPEEFRLQVEQ